MQGIVGFFPTVNNMEMLKIAIFQRVSTYAHQGDLTGLSRGFLGSLNREAAGKARASAGNKVAGSLGPGLRHAEPEDAAALRGGGAAAKGEGRRAAPVTKRPPARHVGAPRCGHWPEARVQETGLRRHSRGLC